MFINLYISSPFFFLNYTTEDSDTPQVLLKTLALSQSDDYVEAMIYRDEC